MNVNRNQPVFLSVRETANRLAVHENTVRNWANSGVLPTSRVPGSRFHRFDERDVERLRRERGETVSSVGADQSTIGPELVDATQLHQWANARQAQQEFPELIRKLLASTHGVHGLSMRSGDGVSAPGWDGTAVSDGSSPYLPKGKLFFELGVGDSPKSKAQADYDKRTAEPEGADPATSTFLFVTPRRFKKSADWVRERLDDAVWANVAVMDADDLEGWLQDTPAVHFWISEKLGRAPEAGQTLERWWRAFQGRTMPPLPRGLFLAGREQQKQELLGAIRDKSPVIAVGASSRDEAIAFVSATLADSTDALDEDAPEPLVVTSAKTWDRVVAAPSKMLLIAGFENPDIASATRKQHIVLTPLGRSEVGRGDTIQLPPPHPEPAREAIQGALIAAELDPDDAFKLAALARRSLPALLRSIAQDPRIARPPWSKLPYADVFAPLVLVNTWNETDADYEIVARLASSAWQAVERTLLDWRDTEDPPFIKSGDTWHVASLDEAFLVLRPVIGTDDLKRWREIVLEVLGEKNPKLELDPDERPFAALRNSLPVYSPTLRKGLATGVAMLGGIDNALMSDGISGADHASSVVRSLMTSANGDPTGRLWQSLEGELPRLAEAAPDTFLNCVEDALALSPSPLLSMFQDGENTSWLYSSSPHTGLLWALETLCWSPDYLLEATSCLAELDAIDPGGRLNNRPIESLESVLVPWIRHTSAPISTRIGAVRRICQKSPPTGWKVLMALWPSNHATASPPAEPRFRDWKPIKRGVPIPEWLEFVETLVDEVINLADRDMERWSEIAKRLGPLPPEERDRLIVALEKAAEPEDLSSDDRLQLWESLRKEIAHHHAYPGAGWSMDEVPLSRLSILAERLKPEEAIEHFAYLFDWHPDLPGVERSDHAAHAARLSELRSDAVEETLSKQGAEGLKRLAERAPVPRHLGWAVGDVERSDIEPTLLSWLDNDDERLKLVAAAWGARRFAEGGIDWLRHVMADPEMNALSRQLALVLNVEASHEVWTVIAETGETLKDEYWKLASPWQVNDDDATEAVETLVAYGRPWQAIDLLAFKVKPSGERADMVKPDLVRLVLDAAMTAGPPDQATLQSVEYELGKLLDFLEEEGAEKEVLARYEWFFFRLLEHYREPRALFSALADDPRFYVELVSRVYKGKNERRQELSEEDSNLATHAWSLLNNWKRIPGAGDDGKVDSEHLKHWVYEARRLLDESDRTDIGDEQIGQVLSASPLGVDGAWPAEPVREIVETVGNRRLETGMHIGLANARGVTSRGVYDGGEQERRLAADYRRYANLTANDWPRTSKMLRGIAEDYERDARREDAEAAHSADTE